MSVKDLITLGTSSQQPTRNRNHGAYLLRWNNEGLLFDPGEGTQRQFIFAHVAPTVVTRIFVSHFHGDHCLGLGSMLMRLNLDKVKHVVHCYYPASGKKFFDRLRYGTMYYDGITVEEHPIEEEGLVHQDETFTIEGYYLEHGVDNVAWRITEKDKRRFYKDKVQAAGIKGLKMKELTETGKVELDGKLILIDELSYIQKGEVFTMISDTRVCEGALRAAKDATLLLSESTYLESHKEMAHKHYHLTAKQAAGIAKEARAKKLILTHFSARYSDTQEFLEEARPIFPNTHVAEDLKRFTFY